MRVKFVCLAMGIALAMAAQARASLVVTEAMSSGETDDWFELTNFGFDPVNITGYRMDDSGFAFGSSVLLNGITTIAPGESVVFIENSNDAAIAEFRQFWGGIDAVQIGRYNGSGVGLSSSGDGVVVFDGAGIEVTPRATFGSATGGISFGYNPLTSSFGDLSVAGTFGAFISADPAGNIGSPGAVPEPTAVATITIAAICLGAITRRWRLLAC
jgi:hypothetical protein